MALTPEDIANIALGLLDEAPIDSLAENNRAARMVNLHYEQTRMVELKKNTWVFAIMSVSTNSTAVDGGEDVGQYSYPIPPDALRILPLTENGEPDGYPIPFRQEAGFIYAGKEGPRRIRYIGNLIDPNDMDPLFIDVWTAAIAVKIAHAITHKTGMIDIALRAYQTALNEARRVNAFERGYQVTKQTWAQARRDYR
jgi:hypothetical protein